MQVAQALYEGIDLGGSEGTVGLITYMRTDSTRISDQAREAAREFIVGRVRRGVSRRPRHRIREGAQDAHEAIRPTSVLPHAGAPRPRPQTRRAAALYDDLGAVRRLADVGGPLRSNHRRRFGQRVRLPRDRYGDALCRLYARVRGRQRRERYREGARAPSGAERRRGLWIAASSSPSSTSPSRRRATRRRHWSKRSKTTASAGPPPTRRSSRRFRPAAT